MRDIISLKQKWLNQVEARAPIETATAMSLFCLSHHGLLAAAVGGRRIKALAFRSVLDIIHYLDLSVNLRLLDFIHFGSCRR